MKITVVGSMHAGLLLSWIRPLVKRELWGLVRDQWLHLGVWNKFVIHGERFQVCRRF